MLVLTLIFAYLGRVLGRYITGSQPESPAVSGKVLEKWAKSQIMCGVSFTCGNSHIYSELLAFRLPFRQTFCLIIACLLYFQRHVRLQTAEPFRGSVTSTRFNSLLQHCFPKSEVRRPCSGQFFHLLSLFTCILLKGGMMCPEICGALVWWVGMFVSIGWV